MPLAAVSESYRAGSLTSRPSVPSPSFTFFSVSSSRASEPFRFSTAEGMSDRLSESVKPSTLAMMCSILDELFFRLSESAFILEMIPRKLLLSEPITPLSEPEISARLAIVAFTLAEFSASRVFNVRSVAVISFTSSLALCFRNSNSEPATSRKSLSTAERIVSPLRR